MKTSSAKAKGRRCAKEVKEELLKYFYDLEDLDIQVTSSGANGPDLILSPRALNKFPVVIECKNTEKLNVHASYKQAEAHSTLKAHKGLLPLLCYKKNHSELMVSLKMKDFFNLMLMSQLRAIENAIIDLNKKDLGKNQVNSPGACL